MGLRPKRLLSPPHLRPHRRGASHRKIYQPHHIKTTTTTTSSYCLLSRPKRKTGKALNIQLYYAFYLCLYWLSDNQGQLALCYGVPQCVSRLDIMSKKKKKSPRVATGRPENTLGTARIKVEVLVVGMSVTTSSWMSESEIPPRFHGWWTVSLAMVATTCTYFYFLSDYNGAVVTNSLYWLRRLYDTGSRSSSHYPVFNYPIVWTKIVVGARISKDIIQLVLMAVVFETCQQGPKL